MLYVIEQGEYSGAEVMHLPLMRADADPLLATPPGSRTETWARTAGIPTVALNQRTLRHSAGPLEALRSVGRGLSGARELRRLLRRHPDRKLVYAVAIRSGLLASVAALGLGRRVVWFVSDFPPPPLLRVLTRLVARVGAARLLATSEAAAQRFAGRSRALRRRTHVVYPGIEVERFASAGDAERDPARAAVLGHVSPTKRTDLAVEVVRRVAPIHPELHLDVIGRAQYRDEDFAFEERLHAHVAADPVTADHLTFRGYATDPAAELRRYGILLHCRPDEPFGIAVIEAMAAGLAVVVPRSDGPAEIVRHDETGLTYRPGDAGDAARQVRRLLAEPGLRDRLAAAALDDVRRRFSVARQVALMDDALCDLAATTTGTRK